MSNAAPMVGAASGVAYASGTILIGCQNGGSGGRPSAGRTHHGAHAAGCPLDGLQNAGNG